VQLATATDRRLPRFQLPANRSSAGVLIVPPVPPVSAPVPPASAPPAPVGRQLLGTVRRPAHRALRYSLLAPRSAYQRAQKVHPGRSFAIAMSSYQVVTLPAVGSPEPNAKLVICGFQPGMSRSQRSSMPGVAVASSNICGDS
jgi:hypothetical protein